MLHGDDRAARPLAAHPGVDVVVRPGEEAAGSHLAIVDAGVDPAWAAEEVAASAFTGAGQSCGSVERVHVHRAVAEPFLDELTTRARALRIGPGSDPRTELGPLIDDDQRVWVHRQVEDAVHAGAELFAGGLPLPRAGFFYPPTVLVGAPDDALVICGETRGPVVSVRVVRDVRGGAVHRPQRRGERAHAVARPRAARVARASGAHDQRRRGVPRRRAAGAELDLLDAVTRTKVVHLSR